MFLIFFMPYTEPFSLSHLSPSGPATIMIDPNTIWILFITKKERMIIGKVIGKDAFLDA